MTDHNMTDTAQVTVSKVQNATESTLPDLKRELASDLYRTLAAYRELGLAQQDMTQCIEAVAQALSLREEPNPGAVAESLLCLQVHLRALKWTSPKARSMALCRLGVAMIGTQRELDKVKFLERLRTMTLTRVPAALRAVSAVQANAAHRDRLNAVADECQTFPLYDSYMTAANAAAEVIDRSGIFPLALAICLAGESATYAANVVTTDVRNERRMMVYLANCAIAAAHAQSDASAIVGRSLDKNAASLMFERLIAEYAETVVQVLRELVPAEHCWLEQVPTPSCEAMANPGSNLGPREPSGPSSVTLPTD